MGMSTDAVSTITITLKTDGQVEVSGPLDNKILFFGMLEMAKGIAIERNMKSSGANLMVVPPLKGLKNN